MNFDKALSEVWKQTPLECRPKGDPNIAKTLAIMWSMIALALKESEGEVILDDVAYIGNNSDIVSIPLYDSSDDEKQKDEDKIIEPPKDNDETIKDDSNDNIDSNGDEVIDSDDDKKIENNTTKTKSVKTASKIKDVTDGKEEK